MSRAKAAHAVLFQRRVLTIVTSILVIGFVLWIVAVATDHWCLIDGGTGIPIKNTEKYFLQARSGLWRTCRTVYSNETKLLTLTGSEASLPQ